MLRGLKQTLCAPGPRDPTETETELCLSVSCGGQVSSGLLQRQGLWVQQTWLWHKPYSSWRKSSLTPPQSHQNLHRTGKQTLGGHKQKFVCTRTQEKGAVTPQETDPYMPMSVQESPTEAWCGGGLLQGWRH